MPFVCFVVKNLMSETAAQLPFRLPPPEAGRPDLLIVAGEHSGDEHAARAVQELRTKNPAV